MILPGIRTSKAFRTLAARLRPRLVLRSIALLGLVSLAAYLSGVVGFGVASEPPRAAGVLASGQTVPWLPLQPDLHAKVTSKVLAQAERVAFGTKHSGHIPRIIHQQWRSANLPSNFATMSATFRAVDTYAHLLWTDADLSDFVRKYHPTIHALYLSLPKPILRADLARYLLLLTFGGLYSDLDTILLRHPDRWADQHAAAARLIVGVEVDTTRPDWPDWYARSLQFCQWTIASARGHRVLHRTASMAVAMLREALAQTETDSANAESISTASDAALATGPPDVDTLETTGPGTWTDAIFAELLTHNVGPDNLRKLEHATLVGDIVILPITGFSPGVGTMGAKGISDPEARVHHLFEGSWKKDKDGKE
nr:membrane-bound alpha-1,6- mannosyltransferase Initiation-specific [Polyrhizophydium stewartii]